MNKKTKGKEGVMTLKLDMSKAYDKIEWKFMVKTFKVMVKLIKHYIETFSYRILINRKPSKQFFPERELHKGDPLSPYLFVIYADVISKMLRREARDSRTHGIKISRKAPVTTHIFFVDDILIFIRANVKEGGLIMIILI